MIAGTTTPAAVAPPGHDIACVLCTLPFAPAEIAELRRAFAPAEFIHCAADDAAGIAAALARADVAVLKGDLDDRHLAAPHLRWIHCDHSGLTRSARPEVFEKDLVVTGAAGRSAAALAQHGFYFALALTFDARGLLAAQDGRQWRGVAGYENRQSLAGRTLGIVGLGNTGREMAALGQAFGMRVIAYTRSVQPDHPHVDRLLCGDRGDSLDALLDEADVIMLATQLTDATYHLFSDAQFRRMKRGAWLINMARGNVVDEAALIRALEAGEIAGAGLDVFAQEPLPAGSPLWGVPNLYITPHQTPALPDRTRRSIDMIVENVRRWRTGEAMLNAITPKDVYTPRP